MLMSRSGCCQLVQDVEVHLLPFLLEGLFFFLLALIVSAICFWFSMLAILIQVSCFNQFQGCGSFHL